MKNNVHHTVQAEKECNQQEFIIKYTLKHLANG